MTVYHSGKAYYTLGDEIVAGFCFLAIGMITCVMVAVAEEQHAAALLRAAAGASPAAVLSQKALLPGGKPRTVAVLGRDADGAPAAVVTDAADVTVGDVLVLNSDEVVPVDCVLVAGRVRTQKLVDEVLLGPDHDGGLEWTDAAPADAEAADLGSLAPGPHGLLCGTAVVEAQAPEAEARGAGNGVWAAFQEGAEMPAGAALAVVTAAGLGTRGGRDMRAAMVARDRPKCCATRPYLRLAANVLCWALLAAQVTMTALALAGVGPRPTGALQGTVGAALCLSVVASTFYMAAGGLSERELARDGGWGKAV